MATLFLGALLPVPVFQFFDDAGNPLAGGKLYSYRAGTTTPQALYTDAALSIPYSNPIVLDGNGRAPGPIHMLAGGYKIDLQTSLGVSVSPYPADNVFDPGQVLAGTLGNVLATGSFGKLSGYTVLVTDRIVTMSSTAGPNPCIVNLPPAGNASQPVTIKNMGTVPLSIVPNGADTIDSLAAAFAVAASTSPTFKSVLLVPDGVSAWWVLASHL